MGAAWAAGRDWETLHQNASEAGGKKCRFAGAFSASRTEFSSGWVSGICFHFPGMAREP